MHPSKHLIASIPLIIIFFPIYKYFTLLILISSYLIDFDHYLWYILKFKDLNLKRAIKTCVKQIGKNNNNIHIFHTMEFALIIATTSLIFYPYSFPLLIGFTIHLLLDFIHLFKKKLYNDRILSLLEII
ncbi:MAG: hypothetical protein KJ674_00295 [Nanoarchaeota archaeon]|nr:hypothetical protein [Nanoarchaeota archaeon]